MIETMTGYWMYEESGILRPVVEAFLQGKRLEGNEVTVMRAYLRQWIDSPLWLWRGPEIDGLRNAIDSLQTHEQIETWLTKADAIGIYPL